MGHPVLLGNWQVAYFAAGEQLSAGESEAIGFDFFEEASLRNHPRLRRVLTSLIPTKPKIYGVLHWSDGSDLTVLDQMVRDGDADNTDFAGALFAEPRSIFCLACESQLRVLAVDTGQPLFARDRAERLRAHKLKGSCPVCAGHLALPIVEFITG
jgi:hypothetical protein